MCVCVCVCAVHVHVLSQVLARRGIACEEAENGSDAVERVRGGARYRLILMDKVVLRACGCVCVCGGGGVDVPHAHCLLRVHGAYVM